MKLLKSQILNIDETGLFLEKMPARTHLANEEKLAPRHKVAKDRLILLTGGSAASDFKLKPMPVCHSENLRALKGEAKACYQSFRNLIQKLGLLE
jgi:hypothetical protein